MRLLLITAPTVEPLTLDEAKLHLRVDGGEDNTLITSLISTARQLAESETKRAFITQTWRMVLDTPPEVIRIPKPPLQSVVSIKTISATENMVDETSALGQPILLVASTTGFAVDDTVVVNRDGEREESLIVLSIQAGISLTMTTNLVAAHTAAQADRVEKYTLVNALRYYVDSAGSSNARIKLCGAAGWPIHRNFSSFIVEFICGYGALATDVPTNLSQAMFVIIAHLYENRGAEGSVKARVQAIDEAKILLWPFKILRI